MRNIPVFSTDFGVSSLVLEQIPYTGTAYVHIRDTLKPELFFDECVQFCRAAGAEQVLACGHTALQAYPLSYQIFTMQTKRCRIGDTDACLIPATEDTLHRWTDLYNRGMLHVDGAAYLSTCDRKRLLNEGDCYFVHRDGLLLGIGKASGETIHTLAAVKSGCGETVLQALCHALSGETVCLQVASTNTKAMRLYERCGFIKSGLPVDWYQIL